MPAAHLERLPAMLMPLSDGLRAEDSPPGVSGVLGRIAQTNVGQLTPIGALALLDEFKRQLRHAAAPSPLAAP